MLHYSLTVKGNGDAGRLRMGRILFKMNPEPKCSETASRLPAFPGWTTIVLEIDVDSRRAPAIETALDRWQTNSVLRRPDGALLRWSRLG